MSKYNNSKIYTIRCKTNNKLIYIGSTIQPLNRVLNFHKYYSSLNNNNLFYNTVNNNWDDWYIELYDNFNCENKEELNKKTYDIMRNISTLNFINNFNNDMDFFNNHIINSINNHIEPKNINNDINNDIINIISKNEDIRLKKIKYREMVNRIKLRQLKKI